MNSLKLLPVWVNWRFNDNHSKVPYNALTGKYAKSNDKSTWSTYQTAESVLNNYDGIGFMFSDGICGIDIDGTDGHTKENKLTAELLELFNGTYIEKSPSGSGYHIIFYCDINQIPTIKENDKLKLNSDYYQKNPHNKIECYISGLTNRFFTYTGNEQSRNCGITDKTEEVLYFLNRYMKRGEIKMNDKILDIARKSKTGNKFIMLYDKGDISAYNNDDSSGDIALCNILAFYLQGNAEEIDQTFRHSALYRPKWERKDYRESTISKAIALCGGEYYKGRGRPSKKGNKTPFYNDLTPDVLNTYLLNKGVSVRFNDITKSVDIDGMIHENKEHIQSNIATILFSELQSKYKRCNIPIVSAYLDVIASRNKYNPVLDYLNQFQYDGLDYLSELYNILNISEDDTLSRILIKKWLWQSISLLHNSADNPFGADGVLVITGKQGIGKTSLFRKLALSPHFFKEGIALDFRDKDTYIRALSCWIGELGEIETTFKSDVERLKAFITQNVDEYRKAYGRGDIRAVRHTSLCGTCNSEEFLIDYTGNRRFWSVAINKIDLEKLSNFNAVQLWKQIQSISKDDLQGFRLTKEEQTALSERNAKHQKKLKGESEIEDILNLTDTNEFCIVPELMTATEFKQIYNNELHYYTVSQIGKVLDKLGYDSEIKKVNNKTQRLRMLPNRKYKDLYY